MIHIAQGIPMDAGEISEAAFRHTGSPAVRSDPVEDVFDAHLYKIAQNYVHKSHSTEFCAADPARHAAKIGGMSKGRPTISEGASLQAKRLHAFLLQRGLTARGWSAKAGVSSSLLTELFSGRTQSVTYANLLKLARAADTTPEEIVGGAIPIRDEQVSTVDVYRAVFAWATAEGSYDPAAAAAAVIAFLDRDEEARNNCEEVHPSHRQ